MKFYLFKSSVHFFTKENGSWHKKMHESNDKWGYFLESVKGCVSLLVILFRCYKLEFNSIPIPNYLSYRNKYQIFLGFCTLNTFKSPKFFSKIGIHYTSPTGCWTAEIQSYNSTVIVYDRNTLFVFRPKPKRFGQWPNRNTETFRPNRNKAQTLQSHQKSNTLSNTLLLI